MRNIFLEKSLAKCVGELVPDPFLKNENWAYLWTNYIKFFTVCFCCMPNWGLSKYIKTNLQTTCLYHILSFFKKQKEVWNQSPCLIFSIIFEEKYFSSYILLIDQVSSSDCLYIARYWALSVLFVNQFVMSWILKLTWSF